MSIQTDVTGRKLRIQDLPKYLIAYLCWLFTAASTMVAILLLRNAINVVWPALGGSRWVLRPIDRFGLVLMGLGWLVFVLYTENVYRTAVTKGLDRRKRPARARWGSDWALTKGLRRMGLDLLASRFARTLLVPIGMLALSHLLQQVALLALAA